MKLTKFEKLMLVNAQPIKFWLNIVGGFTVLYFLWEHDIIKAILLGGTIIFVATILAKKYSKLNDAEIAKTRMGNIFFTIFHKVGLICYLISHILIPLSFWYHNLVFSGLD